MTQAQEKHLERLKEYLDSQLVALKGHLAHGLNATRLSYHTDALKEARIAIIEQSKQRIKDIASHKETFKDSPRLSDRMVRSANRSFNVLLKTREKLSNIHYNDCIKNGLKVQKLDLSSFIVDESDGL